MDVRVRYGGWESKVGGSVRWVGEDGGGARVRLGKGGLGEGGKRRCDERGDDGAGKGKRVGLTMSARADEKRRGVGREG